MERGRQIMFRAWDKVRKEFICEGFHVYGEVTMFSLIDQHLYETKKEGETTLGNLDRVEITEFTGVFDKNKKPIYDGDIVRIQHADFPAEVGEIIWNTNMCRFEISGQNYCPPNSNWEVVGTVYENPELTK